MGKRCKVNNCPSGRKNEDKFIEKSKTLSFFQARTPARLEVWKKSLGIDLKLTDNICYHHFKSEHIKMYEKFIFNGQTKLIPFGKKMLSKDTIPTIEHQFKPIAIEKDQFRIINLRTVPEAELLKKYQAQESIDNLQNIKGLSVLPDCWSFVETSNGYEFKRVDPSNGHIKNHIRISKDLSITIIRRNNNEFKMKDKFDLNLTMYEFLESVEKWLVCRGAQIKNIMFAKKCTGLIEGLDADLPKLQRRCKYCRLLRDLLKERKTSRRRQNPLKQAQRKVKEIQNEQDNMMTSNVECEQLENCFSPNDNTESYQSQELTEPVTLHIPEDYMQDVNEVEGEDAIAIEDETECNMCKLPTQKIKEELPLCVVCAEQVSQYYEFRFVCLQCCDAELCDMCFTEGQHYEHYVLRVPTHKTHVEVVNVVTRLREQMHSVCSDVNTELNRKERDDFVEDDESEWVDLCTKKDPLEPDPLKIQTKVELPDLKKIDTPFMQIEDKQDKGYSTKKKNVRSAAVRTATTVAYRQTNKPNDLPPKPGPSHTVTQTVVPTRGIKSRQASEKRSPVLVKNKRKKSTGIQKKIDRGKKIIILSNTLIKEGNPSASHKAFDKSGRNT